ncbi:MAG: hypothetical protein D9V44_03240 [Actinobacteria bacterium]|nr:MAG: hypothetical protein D9V44_03240 [Actinomycetota bacterium]
MKLALVQLMLRPDEASDRVALAEATARAVARGVDAVVMPVDAVGSTNDLDVLGRVVTLSGDAAIDPEELGKLSVLPPDVLVLTPGAESDIQAEAVLELALALSFSVAGLVIVSERSGAEPGIPGHGGSAIVLLGEVLAEAMADDDILYAEIPVPIPPPGPRALLPAVPPILLQRLAHHRGQRLSVEYPADLT